METEGICCWGDDNGSGKMEIFETKSEATERFWSYKSKWMPDEKVKVFKVLPLTVTYSLPTRNKKK